jgi:hypothetical protein
MKFNFSLACLVVTGISIFYGISPSSINASTEFTSPPPDVNFFYKRDGTPHIFLKNYRVCHVQNPAQFSLLQSQRRTDKKIRVVQNDSYRAGVPFVGSCPWPGGLYRLSNNSAVYYLSNDERSACWVRTSQGVERAGGWGNVQVVDTPFSNLIGNRQYKDRC